MNVSVSDAKAQLTDLVRRAESGEEVILTRHGVPIVRLAALRPPQPTREQKRAILESLRGCATPGPSAARSQDFLYNDDTGLPE